MKGFSMIELMIVVGIIGLVSMIAMPSLGKAQNIDKVNRAAYKIKYDIQYVQSLSYTTPVSDRYAIAFRNPTIGGIRFSVVAPGVYDFDYVCFEDKDGDRLPCFDPANAIQNEVLQDPMTRQPMTVIFSDVPQNGGGGAFASNANPLVLQATLQSAAWFGNTLFFNTLGTPRTSNAANSITPQNIINNPANQNIITISNQVLQINASVMIYPLTGAMTIR